MRQDVGPAVRRRRRQRQAHDVAFPRRRLENPQDTWASVDLIVNRIPLSEDVHQTGSSPGRAAEPLRGCSPMSGGSRWCLSPRCAGLASQPGGRTSACRQCQAGDWLARSVRHTVVQLQRPLPQPAVLENSKQKRTSCPASFGPRAERIDHAPRGAAPSALPAVPVTSSVRSPVCWRSQPFCTCPASHVSDRSSSHGPQPCRAIPTALTIAR